MGNAMGTLMVYNAIPIQQAAKLPVFSTNYGDIDGNNQCLVSKLERDTREKQISSSLKAL